MHHNTHTINTSLRFIIYISKYLFVENVELLLGNAQNLKWRTDQASFDTLYANLITRPYPFATATISDAPGLSFSVSSSTFSHAFRSYVGMVQGAELPPLVNSRNWSSVPACIASTSAPLRPIPGRPSAIKTRSSVQFSLAP